jgi:hypothetical protein
MSSVMPEWWNRKEFLDDEVEDGELTEPDLSTLNVNLVGGIFTGKLGLS